MRAVRLHDSGLVVEEIEVPSPQEGEALVRVHAAAITRDELTWPEDRLPATPSYELAGVVAQVAPDVDEVAVGDEVFALTWAAVQALVEAATAIRDRGDFSLLGSSPPGDWLLQA